MKKIIITILTILLMSITSYASDTFVWIGDSRTVMMSSLYTESTDDVFICQSAMGNSWFNHDALPLFDEYKKNHPNDKITVFMQLGVNDVDRPMKYIQDYKLFMHNYPDVKVYFVSVNPVDETKQKYLISNSQINHFNEKLNKAFPDNYIDTFDILYPMIYNNTDDGLHYKNEVSIKWHDFVRHFVRGKY